jgi:hypothetical protein
MRTLRVLPILLLAAAVPASSTAHEVGTMTVSASVDNHRYTADVTLDAYSLLARLDAAAGRRRSDRATTSRYVSRLRMLRHEILELVSPQFDGVETRPQSIEVLPADQTVAPANGTLEAVRVVLRLSGSVPPCAREFTWASRLTFATYPLIVKRAGGSVGRMEWIDNANASGPFTLAPGGGPWLTAVPGIGGLDARIGGLAATVAGLAAAVGGVLLMVWQRRRTNESRAPAVLSGCALD